MFIDPWGPKPTSWVNLHSMRKGQQAKGKWQQNKKPGSTSLCNRVHHVKPTYMNWCLNWVWLIDLNGWLRWLALILGVKEILFLLIYFQDVNCILSYSKQYDSYVLKLKFVSLIYCMTFTTIFLISDVYTSWLEANESNYLNTARSIHSEHLLLAALPHITSPQFQLRILASLAFLW